MTETALILLLKLSEIPKSYIYIHYKFLILADCHTRGITLIACPILPRRCLWTIAISMQSLRSLLRPPIKINIVKINHTNTCKGNYKQLTRKIQ